MDVDPFPGLPIEMKLDILGRLPHADLLTLRLVNSFCKKILISDLIREWPYCILSDDTWSTVVNSSEAFRTLKIAKLTGEDKAVSSTCGVGQALSNARALQLLGREIEDAIFPKIAGYLGNISELQFYNTTAATVQAAFQGTTTEFVYPKVTTLKLTHTSSFRRNLGNDGIPSGLSEYANLSLPQLHGLSIHWTDDGQWEGGGSPSYFFYYNLFKLIASVAHKLTSLEFMRDATTVRRCLRELSITPVPFLDGLRNLKLQKLKITTSFGGNRVQELLQMERMLLQSPQLQELYLENIFFLVYVENHQEPPNFPTIASLIPAASAATLQRLVIHSCYYGPNLFSLAPFRNCVQLKELTLIFYYDFDVRGDDYHQRTRLSDLEMLPGSLELLQFVLPQEAKETKEFRQRFPRHVATDLDMILSRAQLEWLAAGSLPQLKHLGCLLIVGEERPQREEVNADLSFFRELLGVNQWISMEFNMLAVASLRGSARRPLPSRVRRDTHGLESYLDFCRSHADIRKMESRLLIDKYVQVSLIKGN